MRSVLPEPVLDGIRNGSPESSPASKCPSCSGISVPTGVYEHLPCGRISFGIGEVADNWPCPKCIERGIKEDARVGLVPITTVSRCIDCEATFDRAFKLE